MKKLLMLLGLIGLGGIAYVAAKRLMAAEAVGFAAPPSSGPTNLSPAYTAPVPPAAEAPASAADDSTETKDEPVGEPAGDLGEMGDLVAEGVAPVTPEQVEEATADETAEPEPSPHGPGSALSLEGGASPHPSYGIKGNADSMKYHPADSPYYGRTIAEVWFKDEASAQAAGFVHWREKATEKTAEKTAE